MKTRKTLRDTLLENQKAEKSWAAAFGKPVRDDLEPVKEKRVHTKKMADSDREDSVMREIKALLAVHPKVLWAVRMNSGMSQNANGAPVFFHTWVRSKVPMLLPDFIGQLVDGRLLGLECKNRLWTHPSGDREGKQQNCLMTIRNAGGVSGFVTSAEQAQKILEG